ncbi:MAG: L,D-transpeptidase family protein [Phascolarctobacterium sp.]|nr:L,D-transpeptidase family protein [Phascolarctobacterium sp.]
MRNRGLFSVALVLFLVFMAAFGAIYKLMDTYLAEKMVPDIAAARINIALKKPPPKEEVAAQPEALPPAVPFGEAGKAAPPGTAPEAKPGDETPGDPKEHSYSVLIKKGTFTVFLMDNGKAVMEYRCAIGQNPGQKEVKGDHRTPTGTFPVDDIADATGWSYDFGDGRGRVRGGYGPWYISLDTHSLSRGRWDGIGIMGTSKTDIIGKMATAGGVRLNNDDISDLVKYIKRGTEVTIEE